MNAPLYGLDGKKKGEVPLGKAFSRPVREDVIRRAFLSEASAGRQPYGSDPLAGKRTSAHYHGLRGYRHSMMNKEMARMKRIHGQGFLNLTARFVPQARKGRRAHPPKIERVWLLKINRKERTLALHSALAATCRKEFVLLRHPSLKEAAFPLILEDGLQSLTKTREVASLLDALGVGEEAADKKRIRAGKGTRRGRKYRRKRGILFIVKEGSLPAPPGCEVVSLKDLRVSDLAPGGQPGRLCIWTQSALAAASEWS